MYRGKSVALVIPVYNEERLLGPTLKAVPGYVERVFVVDDNSTDSTRDVVREYAKDDKRIVLVEHETNRGPGQGIVTGYNAALEEGWDIIAVCGGDNQMPLDELSRLIDPLVEGKADYTKGNRFMEEGNAFADMPKIRLLGNTIISLLTKISSGYYSIFDVVDGFTAITKKAAQAINWDKAWKGYGYPMDFLMRLNVKGFRVLDVPRRAIYLEGERQSQIKGFSYALKVSPMLLRNFVYRLNMKYLFSNFHPLFFLFYAGFIFTVLGLWVGFIIINAKLNGGHPSGATAIFCALLLNLGVQSLFFATLFDMMEEKKT
ncbi:MAG: glycosyltransferase family 2 protein [Candidatus Omnitrophica bacterium]|nr:glycosyltransferase family 2 protein [Candidatus Omnitrophota bacterium]